MIATYVIPGRRDDAKAVCASLAGNWIITTDRSPYVLMELPDVERLYPLDTSDAIAIEELEIIQDNISVALREQERKENG